MGVENNPILLETRGIVVDAATFPVVVIRFMGAPTLEDFAAFLATISSTLDRRMPFVAVIDAREGCALPFGHIVDAARWLEREGDRRRAYCRGTALVLPGPVQRAVLSAVLRLAPMERHDVFHDVPAAVAWALRVLSVTDL